MMQIVQLAQQRVLMDFHFTDDVSIAGRPGGLALDFPELCCNCGASENILWIETKVVRTILVPVPLIVGIELSLPVRLPSCSQCIPTMTRGAPTLTSLALLTILLFLLASFPSWFLAGFFVATGPQRFESTLDIALVLAMIFQALWFGFFRRPRNGQSTAFQPVRLVGVRRRWLTGEIKQITLKFTNDMYRARFVESNSDLLRENVVRVK